MEYGQVNRMHDEDDCWIKKCMNMDVEGKRERGRPAKWWMDMVKEDLKEKGLGLGPEASVNRVLWRTVVRAKRPNPGK